MTKKQRITLMADLWPAACRLQNWNENDRDRRLEVCSIALSFEISTIQDFGNAFYSNAPCSRQLTSTNDIDDDKDFTRVKNLLLMLADNLKGAHEVDKPQINKARQMRYVIEHELLPCIGVYHPNPRAYVQEVIGDKFKRYFKGATPTLDDLTDDPIELRGGRRIPSHLRQLVFTLNSRLNAFRSAKNHSEHQMKQFARVKCRATCKECYP